MKKVKVFSQNSSYKVYEGHSHRGSSPLHAIDESLFVLQRNFQHQVQSSSQLPDVGLTLTKAWSLAPPTTTPDQSKISSAPTFITFMESGYSV